MHNLTEKRIRKILRNQKQELNIIRDKMLRLYEDLKDVNASAEMMRAAALPGMALTGMPGGKGTHKGLEDVYLKYQRSMYERNEELRTMMWYLSEEEDSIRRLWTCFYALSDPYYTIIKRLYVNKELYQTVQSEFECSHSTFERYRTEALRLLARLYHSETNVTQLIMLEQERHMEKRTSSMKKDSVKEYEQLHLNLEEIK